MRFARDPWIPIAVAAAVAAATTWYLWHRRNLTRAQWNERDIVDVASEHSFPASDPPSWTGTTA